MYNCEPSRKNVRKSEKQKTNTLLIIDNIYLDITRCEKTISSADDEDC